MVTVAAEQVSCYMMWMYAMMTLERIMIIVIRIVVSKLFLYGMMVGSNHTSIASMSRPMVQGVGRESGAGVRTTRVHIPIMQAGSPGISSVLPAGGAA